MHFLQYANVCNNSIFFQYLDANVRNARVFMDSGRERALLPFAILYRLGIYKKIFRDISFYTEFYTEYLMSSSGKKFHLDLQVVNSRCVRPKISLEKLWNFKEFAWNFLTCSTYNFFV